MSFLQNVHAAREQAKKRQEAARNAVATLNIDSSFKFVHSKTDLDSFNEYIPEIVLNSRSVTREQLKEIVPKYTDYLTLTEYYKQVKPPHFDRDSENVNMLVFGIIASKSSVRDSANGSKYISFTFCDLKYDISLFFHGNAFRRFYKLRPGAVIAIFNPKVFAQRVSLDEGSKKGLTNPGFSVSDPDSVVEIGLSRDLGICEAKTTSSGQQKQCHNWVNWKKTHVCDFHFEQKSIRTKRPELNASSAKLWDPRSSSNGKRLAVVQGGEVKWKRGLQVDNQSWNQNEAPKGRVFQFPGFDPRKHDESFQTKKRRFQKDKELLNDVAAENDLRKKLEHDAIVRKRVEMRLGIPHLDRETKTLINSRIVDPVKNRRVQTNDENSSDSDLEIIGKP